MIGNKGTCHTVVLLVLVIGLAGCGGAYRSRQASLDRFHGARGIDIPLGPGEPSWWIDPVIEAPPKPGSRAVVAATIPADTLYEVGSAEVTPAAEQALDAVRMALNGAVITNITLKCHADSTGEASSNQILSEQRAANLASWIASRWHVPNEEITQHGYGDTQPVASNDTPTGRALNRRCDIAITTQSEP